MQSEGLVELTPNRGATVATLTAHDIEQVYSLRAVLESFAAAGAAQEGSEEQFHALEDAHARIGRVRTSGSAGDQALADLNFHLLVSAATGSRLLHSIAGQVLAFTVSYRSNYAYSVERAAEVNEQHRAILDALWKRDPEIAGKLMREHVESSGRYALEQFPRDQPD